MSINGNCIIGFAAQDYKKPIPLSLKTIELNVPTMLPTTPGGVGKATIKINTSIFKNKNFPKVSTITLTHSIQVKLIDHQYTKDDSISKGSKFLIMAPTILVDDMLAIKY